MTYWHNPNARWCRTTCHLCERTWSSPFPVETWRAHFYIAHDLGRV